MDPILDTLLDYILDILEELLAAFTDVHIALPRALVEELDRVAREQGLRRVGLLRSLIESYLRQVERERTGRQMREYADALGPASSEFVRETEPDTVARWLRETEW